MCSITHIDFATFLVSQLNFKCDVVLDTEPVISKVVSLLCSQTFLCPKRKKLNLKLKLR